MTEATPRPWQVGDTYDAYRLLEGGARALRAHGESCACRDPDHCTCGLVVLFDALDRLNKARQNHLQQPRGRNRLATLSRFTCDCC